MMDRNVGLRGFARVGARTALVAVFAIALGLAKPASPVAAAGGSTTLQYGVCDLNTKTIYGTTPTVFALSGSTAVRYWVRFYDIDTGAALTGWWYGGQATATTTTAAAWPTSLFNGKRVTVKYAKGAHNTRAQYQVALQNSNGTWSNVYSQPGKNLAYYRTWGTYSWMMNGMVVASPGWVADRSYC